MSKITLLPDYLAVVQEQSLSFYQTSTNILSAISDYVGEVSKFIDYKRGLTTLDMLSSIGQLFNELNSNNFATVTYDTSLQPTGSRSMSNDFKLYFVEKYQALQQSYKNRVDSIISNNQYFTPISDSVGCYIDTVPVLDNNTLPYNDVFTEQNIIPLYMPQTIFNSISQNEKIIAKTSAYFNDSLFKTNIKGLQTQLDINTAKTSHGNNLITDILFYTRAVNMQQNLLVDLQTLLGEIAEFVSFFKEFNPRDLDSNRKAIYFQYTANIEGVEQRVDLLKNTINTLKLTSKQVLG